MNETLSNEVIKLIFLVLTMIVTTAAPVLLVKLYRYMGLKEEEAKVAADQTIELAKRLKIRNWLLRVEEWAAAKIKAGDTGVTAKVKLEQLLEVAKEEGGVPVDEVLKLAHEELPKLGLGAAGALLGVKTVTVGNASVTTAPVPLP